MLHLNNFFTNPTEFFHPTYGTPQNPTPLIFLKKNFYTMQCSLPPGIGRILVAAS
jgi:hypothetical protein